MRHNRLVAIRNFLILAAVAGLGTFWQEGLGATAGAVQQLVLLAMVVGFGLMGYQYFRENKLKWLVIKPVLRAVIVVCAAGILFLVVVGDRLLGDSIGSGGVIALVAVLVLTIVWIVAQSRRY